VTCDKMQIVLLM